MAAPHGGVFVGAFTAAGLAVAPSLAGLGGMDLKSLQAGEVSVGRHNHPLLGAAPCEVLWLFRGCFSHLVPCFCLDGMSLPALLLGFGQRADVLC